MEKKIFLESVDQIQVPEEDVMNAIKAGVRKGSRMKPKRRPLIKTAAVSAAAAALFISSGFLFPSVASVMAEIPFLAKLYEHDKVAENLASQQLITELNEKAAFGGIEVTVTEAYYDGAMIGITFDVKGEVSGDQDEVYAFYEIFNRDPNIQETMELVKLVPDGDGYKGHIQLSYPRPELSAETTLPFTIIGIGEIEDSWKDEQGKWNFDVPISQLPFETVALDQATELGQHKIAFEKLIKGTSSTAIEYTLSYPEGSQKVRFELFDGNGEQIIGGTSDAKLDKKIEHGTVTEKRRITIPLVPSLDFIEVRPELESGKGLEPVRIGF